MLKTPPFRRCKLGFWEFFDLSGGTKGPLGVPFEPIATSLLRAKVPKTAENFRQLCTGEHEGWKLSWKDDVCCFFCFFKLFFL